MNGGLPSVNGVERDRFLIVGPRLGDHGGLVDRVQGRFPEWTVSTVDSYLDGIADLSRKPARVVLASVDSSLPQLSNAVAGLREAAGSQAKLLLCCTPDAEPIARQVVKAGADDYLVWPLDAKELDAALGFSQPQSEISPQAGPSATDELKRFSELLGAVGSSPSAMLERAAALIQAGLGATGVRIVVEGSTAATGETTTRPVLTAPIRRDDKTVGQVLVGERAGVPYTLGDSTRLSQYAEIVAQLLGIASQHRAWRILAVTDECSGLFNRRYLNERLKEILPRAQDERFAVTVFLFDLDDFKTYNDQFGHGAGDEIIRVIGELLRRCCREHDVVTRYGGDEFAVVFWDPDGPRTAGSRHPECAIAVLNRFKAALQTQEFPRLGPSGQGRLTISGGLATFPWDGATPEALLQRADEALLAAKRAGKNRIHLIGETA